MSAERPDDRQEEKPIPGGSGEPGGTPAENPSSTAVVPAASPLDPAPEGAAAGTAATDQPAVVAPPSRGYRWLIGTLSAAAAVVFLILGGARLTTLFTLPDCKHASTDKTLRGIFDERKIKVLGALDVKPLTSSSSERNCAGRAEIPGGTLDFDYRIDWSGWSKRVTITRAEVEARIDLAQLEAVKKASNDFLSFAKDAAKHGRPPRVSEPTIKELLDKIFDLSEIEGATLAAAEVGKANEWLTAGDRVGSVYMLAGTGVSSIEKLPNDLTVQRQMHRNVAEFAPEFARYLDFQVKMAGMMMEAELRRLAKAGPDLERPEVKREIAEVRSTLAETLTGDLTTLAYDGLSDDWRHQRIAVMTQIAPKAATFLLPEQARALRDHALLVATYVRDKSVQDSVKALAETFAPK